ncbi:MULTISPECIES: mechanosensitive ion channel [unclassified Coleofasciculus]|uniref:mechanosensitive ion channel n=1 Tax=unclassified Coleofasciculus TaxID=2692782 RepID=UPI0018817E17|nr:MULTISPECIES: mechanosensitive ion channel [unclassified Coleofasciculus]MBE9127524.1 mechanosensitive ion channel [Coleofasciculus sp. LEGE 07081]MBE9150891.1 mechanosensitive ion channel [Coleofasciculus sp. LEGE 07092]
MNEIWKGIFPLMGVGVPLQAHLTLAQAQEPVERTVETGVGYAEGIYQNLSAFVPNLIAAIAILLVGILIAWIAAAITKALFNRTNIDNKIAEWITGDRPGAEPPKVEEWISGAVFWIVIIFTVVAVLQTLQLQVVSEPLNTFLVRILDFIPQLVGAAILLLVAWLLASLVKLVATRALRAVGLDERLGQQVNNPSGRPEETPLGQPDRTTNSTTSQFSLSETIGSALYWFVFLLFLPPILSTLRLEGVLEPVLVLLNDILGVLPNILAAIVIAAAGWLVAQVVRRIVTNLLAAAGTDQLGARFGLRSTVGGSSLSWIIGTTVYVLILIPVAIAALNALEIEAISVPAIGMLNLILAAIPRIFTAALILIIAYVLGQFVRDLVTNILTSIGFNRVYRWIGVPEPRLSRPVPTPPPAESQDLGIPTPLREPEPTPPTRTPSELVGIIAFVGIMLFAAVAATNVLQFEALTLIVTGIVVIFGQVLAGLIVFAVGLYFANLVFNLITSSGSRQSRILGQAARIAIIAFSVAMALQQMGIASDIVNLAFGLLLGAIAVAIALSFGLGSRDIAAAQVREWLSSFKEDRHSNNP